MNTNNINPTGAQALIDQLRFEGGYPSKETIDKLYNQLDLQRATQSYLDFMPAMSMQAFLYMHPREMGVSESGGMGVYVEPGAGKSEAIGLTYNTESIYASASVDLKQMGPAVIEIPPMVLGVIDDGFMRFVADLGNAGLDKGSATGLPSLFENHRCFEVEENEWTR